MKDFFKVFIMLVLVMGSMAGFVYLGFVLSVWVWAILEIVIATAVIILFILNFDKWFGNR